MKVNFFENDKNEREFEVYAHELCSRKKFVEILEGLDGVEVVRRPRIFNIYELCIFDYEGYRFRLYEDGWSHTYCFSSPQVDQQVLKRLASHFENYNVLVPVQRSTSKFLVALLIILLGLASAIGLNSLGFISG